MKMICNSPILKKFTNEQSGQVLVWIVLGFLSLIAVAGLVIDGGQAYADHAALQDSANAAALAAAGAVYTGGGTSAVTNGNLYSASSGDNNSSTTLSNVGPVTTTIKTVCLNLLMPSGETCTSTSQPNAVHAYQTNTVNTFFMRFFGVSSLSVGAEATATMQGTAESWNIAIIVDGTQSMGTTDSNCGGLTEFMCAMSGVQTFLGKTPPCSGADTCSLANARARVALFSFPNINPSYNNQTFNYDDTCSFNFSGANEPYTFPSVNYSGYTPVQYSTTSGKTTTKWTGTYQYTDWDSSYYSSTNKYNLNTSDNLVKAVGYGANTVSGSNGTKGCVPNVGGESTYYGGVLAAAQQALLAAQATYTGSKNMIIILSDGQANAASDKFPTATATASTNGISVTSAGTSTWSSTASNLTGTSGTWGTYPDYNNECQQAIAVAQQISNYSNGSTADGTRIYAVAYGSEDSGCGGSGGTDTHLATLPYTANVPFTSVSKLTPCMTMENIASSLTYFYSDANQAGTGVDNSCTSSTQFDTTIPDIFASIAASITTPRLIPNTAT
jgi:Flp pilus assembly protein TadG